MEYTFEWIGNNSNGIIKSREDIVIETDSPDESTEGLLSEHHAADVSPMQDLDQIAAENLIFMAHDGQVLNEFINAGVNNAEHIPSHSMAVVLTADSAEQALAESNAYVHHADGTVDEDYAETELVTEEVITDDWVQYQGEERVEIPAEQIMRTANPHEDMDDHVPLPTVQDEYTALRPYPCDFCSRRFRKRMSLVNHMIAHRNDRTYFLCKLCNCRFQRRAELMHHLQAHPDMPETKEESKPHNDESVIEDFNDNQLFYAHNGEAQTQMATSRFPADTEGASRTTSNSFHAKSSRQARQRAGTFKLEQTLPDYSTNNDYKYVPTTKQEQPVDANIKPCLQYPILDERKPFVCQTCGLAFSREKAMQSHAKNHRSEVAFECSQCTETFWDSEGLQDHLKTHTFEESNSEYEPGDADELHSDSENDDVIVEPLYCSFCGSSFNRHDQLKKHMKTHQQEIDNNENPCCHTCGETFEDLLALLAHAEVHTRSTPFRCVFCGECYFDQIAIGQHLQQEHSSKLGPYSCILCGKSCRNNKVLMKHAWDHSCEKSHPCSKCGKHFQNKARLKRHMESHRDKSVTCDVCQLEFPDGRSLSNHRHSHTSSTGKLFPCDECGKTFGSRSSQQIHVRIHTGEKPYGCSFCWKAFADGGTLRKHERIHTGEKPYGCVICPRAFNQRVVLREHIRTHHSQPDKQGTYYCSFCQAKLPDSNQLIAHVIDHCDKKTAMQRQPIVGPRKYKRRRKLKPHELQNLNNKNLEEDQNSDIDMSDFDVDKINHLLNNMSDTNTSFCGNNAVQSNETDVVLNGGDSGVFSDLHAQTAKQEPTLPQANASHLDSPKQRNNKKLHRGNMKYGGPRMIHTEKSVFGTRIGRQQRHKKTATRTQTQQSAAELTLDKTSISNRALDYEIMSPQVNLPHQISCSPQPNVKQEKAKDHASSPYHRNDELYHAQLLLEASRARKDSFEKFQPDIVHDLEEILASSPSEKGRTRLCSESFATVYMNTQNSEDQHLIKIEPTSPDMRDVVNSPDRRNPARRRGISNRKYLDFETEMPVLVDKSSKKRTPNKSLSSGTEHHLNSLIDYTELLDYDNVIEVPLRKKESNASASITNATLTKPEESKPIENAERIAAAEPERIYECDMCFSGFSTRAQLLEHVHIHI